MSSLKKGLKALYGSKLGKILPVLIIAGLVATASAAVFVNYYGTATATVGNNDISLAAGTDSTACTTNFPCITVTPSSPIADTATIAMNLGKDTGPVSPQPETYFTDAMHIANSGGASRTIKSITISSIVATAPADFGSITVYYCATQTNTPASCAGSFAITSTAGGTVSGLPLSIAASGTAYIEFVGYAGSGATATDTIAFNVQIQWA